MQRISIHVMGRVQGVGFRYHTQLEASRLGLTGYVRNLPNGSVEIIAEGTRQSLDQLTDWANHGPATAAVTQVEVSYAEANGEFSRFEIKR
ncbi:MAG: acylphosphatase [Leptolyngbyaceae cyanobacterium]